MKTGTFFLLAALSWSNASWGGFDYFDTQIDYWKDRSTKKEETAKAPAPAKPTPSPVAPKEEGFEWSKYLDPKNKEFFREGEYLPPEPFMELVRNPSDENIKNWFAYLDKKNELVKRMQERVEVYGRKNTKVSPDVRTLLAQRSTELSTTPEDVKRYRFRLYFDSKCPACQQMLRTLAAIQNRGYAVEAHQIDGDMRASEKLPYPVIRASKSDLDEKKIKAVPILYVGDLKQKRLYRFRGTKDLSEIFEALRSGDGGQPVK